MIDWDWVTLLVTVVAVGLFWLRGRNGQSSSHPYSQLELAVRMARTAVMAAEQLYKSGHLPADARFEYVWKILQNAFPTMDEEQRIAAIEAEVYMLKDET